METTKLCKCCNTTKEINQFNKNKSKKDGLSSECKECIKIYKKEYRLKNAEKIKAGRKKYYEANKEKVLRDNSKWKQENREHHNKTSRDYHHNNRNTILIRLKKYYQDNKEERNRKQLLWNKTPLGKISKRNTHYKRKMAILNGVSTVEIVEYTKNIFNCYWCGCKLDKKIKNGFHLDHYIPLSKGGEHTLTNLVVSCPTCNLQKNAKDPYQFAQERGRLL